MVRGAAFYSYAAPAPEGFSGGGGSAGAARWDAGLGEFVLMYDDVRASASPSGAVLEFCRSTYECGGTIWDSGIGGRWRGTG